MSKPVIIENVDSLQLEVTNARKTKATLKDKIDDIDNALGVKLESPIDQTEITLTTQATANGKAVRYDEFSKRHNNDGTIKMINYNKSSTSNPSATADTYGVAVTLTPLTNYLGLYPTAIDIVFGGTFGSETVTAQITATYSDSTTASVTKTSAATGTISFTNTDLMTLIKDGVFITQTSLQSKSTIASSQATVTFNMCGIYL